jgi:glyoxylase-like metal-dependent hydrolase (beta-lactamase superfamily II)
MKEVFPGIFQVELPLIGNPLKALNSYIIKYDNKALVIDTGFNAPECKEALFGALEELDVLLENVELFVTHLHSDHSGLAAEMNLSGVKIYTGEIDGQMINHMTTAEYWKGFKERAIAMDLVKDGIDFGHHPGYKYCPQYPITYQAMKEGDSIDIGQYRFEVIDIPGHTPGHIALYEPNHRLLISGDHILDPITPNIAFWGFEWDILQVYFDSLKKVREMPVDIVLPSHRKIITNHQKRIDELLFHHQERLEEVIEIVRTEWLSVRDVASKMHWSLRAKDWDAFPDPQKWFASGEAMSHLEHLYITGRLDRKEENAILKYKMK